MYPCLYDLPPITRSEPHYSLRYFLYCTPPLRVSAMAAYFHSLRSQKYSAWHMRFAVILELALLTKTLIRNWGSVKTSAAPKPCRYRAVSLCSWWLAMKDRLRRYPPRDDRLFIESMLLTVGYYFPTLYYILNALEGTRNNYIGLKGSQGIGRDWNIIFPDI